MAVNKWRIFEAIGYHKKIETKHFGTLQYPVPVVRRFHDSKARIRVVRAPARTGKSYSGGADMVPSQLDFDGPPSKDLIVGPDYDKAAKEFGYIFNWLVVEGRELGLPAPTDAAFRPEQGKMYIKWPWGKELHAKSAARFSSLIGDQWDTCLLSETCEHDSFTFFRGLRTRCNRFIWPSTPSVKGMWVKDFVEQNVNDPEVQEFVYPPEANPDYDMDRLREALAQSGPDDPQFREQFLGEWVFYGGRVFPRFDGDSVEDLTGRLGKNGIMKEGGTGAHLVVLDPLEIPNHWMRVGGMDFGWRDATVHLWAAVAPSGEIIIYDEYYDNQRGTRAHYEAVTQMSQMNGTIGDAAIKDRVREPKGLSVQIAEDLMIQYGFFSRPVEGHSRYAARLNIQNYLDTDPKLGSCPKIRIIASRCPNLVRELVNLHYDRERVHREGESEHYLGDDHAVDTLGYILSTRPVTSVVEKQIRNPMSLDVLKLQREMRSRRSRRIGVETMRTH